MEFPMTANTVAQPASIAKIEVIYTVTAKTRNGKVTVTPDGYYACTCTKHALFGECEHTEAVQAQRKAEGRKF
jgi:hypothetical protein